MYHYSTSAQCQCTIQVSIQNLQLLSLNIAPLLSPQLAQSSQLEYHQLRVVLFRCVIILYFWICDFHLLNSIVAQKHIVI